MMILTPRFGFNSDGVGSGDCTATYILNLALTDFFFCLLGAPHYILVYAHAGWPLGRQLCVASAIARWSLALLDWLSLALIALSRYVRLSMPALDEAVFRGRSAAGPVAVIWVAAFGSVLLGLIPPSSEV